MQSYSLATWCHRKQSLLILFTMQSYKSCYMVSPQTVFTYPFHHAKLQSCYMVSPQTVFTYPFHNAKLQSCYMVSPQTVFTYPFHHAKLQVLLHGVTANSLYLSFSPCKATSLATWCHRKQSLLLLFTMQSYKSYLKMYSTFQYDFFYIYDNDIQINWHYISIYISI